LATPKAFVIYGDGINCDFETEWALTQAGFDSCRVHVSNILAQADKLRQCQLCVFPGGFSYGDEIASGKVLAVKLRQRLNDVLHSFIADDNLLLGICNGFQVLVQMGLLPHSEPGKPRVVSLLRNRQGRFINRWVKLAVTPGIATPFLEGLDQIELPMRHGEGRVTLAHHDGDNGANSSHEEAASLVKSRSPLRYTTDVNGSFDRIAGLSNASGNVFGIMPHPEAFIRWTQHPEWTSLKVNPPEQEREAHGLTIFKNAARFLNQARG
jgi:phosphoribosylformylglycinamidine synthase